MFFSKQPKAQNSLTSKDTCLPSSHHDRILQSSLPTKLVIIDVFAPLKVPQYTTCARSKDSIAKAHLVAMAGKHNIPSKKVANRKDCSPASHMITSSVHSDSGALIAYNPNRDVHSRHVQILDLFPRPVPHPAASRIPTQPCGIRVTTISSENAIPPKPQFTPKTTSYSEQTASSCTDLVLYDPAASVLMAYSWLTEIEAEAQGGAGPDQLGGSGVDFTKLQRESTPYEVEHGAFQPAIRSDFLGSQRAHCQLILSRPALLHNRTRSSVSSLMADEAFFEGAIGSPPTLVSKPSSEQRDASGNLQYSNDCVGNSSPNSSNASQSSTLVANYEARIKEIEEDHDAAQKIAEDAHQMEIELILDDQEVMEAELKATIKSMQSNKTQFKKKASLRLKESSAELASAQETIARLQRDLRANVKAANRAREERDLAHEAAAAAKESGKQNTAFFTQELAKTTAHLQRIQGAYKDLGEHYEQVVEGKREQKLHIEALVRDNTMRHIEDPWEYDQIVRPNQTRDLEKALMVSQRMHEKQCELSSALANDLEEKKIQLANADNTIKFLQELVQGPGVVEAENSAYDAVHLRYKLRRALLDRDEDAKRSKQQIAYLSFENAELETSRYSFENKAIDLEAELNEWKKECQIARETAVSWYERAETLAFGSKTDMAKDQFYIQKDARIQDLENELQILRKVTNKQERKIQSLDYEWIDLYHKVKSDLQLAEGYIDQRDFLHAETEAYEKRFAADLITDPLYLDVTNFERSPAELEQLMSIQNCLIYNMGVDPNKSEGNLPSESEYEKLRAAVKSEEDKRLASEIAQDKMRNEAEDNSWIYALPSHVESVDAPGEPTSNTSVKVDSFGSVGSTSEPTKTKETEIDDGEATVSTSEDDWDEWCTRSPRKGRQHNPEAEGDWVTSSFSSGAGSIPYQSQTTTPEEQDCPKSPEAAEKDPLTLEEREAWERCLQGQATGQDRELLGLSNGTSAAAAFVSSAFGI